MMEGHIQRIVDALPAQLPADRRFVIAIAGPPAVGKSTLAAGLADSSSSGLPAACAVLGMDAFHFDDQVLTERGHLDRKGAPHTFDVDGYARWLATLRSEPDKTIAIPEFDRTLELSRNAATIVTPDQKIVVTEGNYLLLDEAPWSDLQPLFDLTVSISVPAEVIEERILDRWRTHGFSTEEARARFTENDQPNAAYVLAHSRAGNITLT